MSHSDNQLVVALCESVEVGVGLQFQDHSTDIEAIARCFFTSREREILSATSPHEKRSMFFRIWVLKEAWLKAQGTGLRVPLSVAEVAGAFDITPPNEHIECFTAPGFDLQAVRAISASFLRGCSCLRAAQAGRVHPTMAAGVQAFQLPDVRFITPATFAVSSGTINITAVPKVVEAHHRGTGILHIKGSWSC
jgi:hypothetical protein